MRLQALDYFFFELREGEFNHPITLGSPRLPYIDSVKQTVDTVADILIKLMSDKKETDLAGLLVQALGILGFWYINEETMVKQAVQDTLIVATQFDKIPKVNLEMIVNWCKSSRLILAAVGPAVTCHRTLFSDSITLLHALETPLVVKEFLKQEDLKPLYTFATFWEK